MMRARYSVRSVLIAMAFLAVTFAAILGLKSYETFSFMSSGAIIDDLDSNEVDGYVNSLEAMGMETRKSSTSGGVRCRYPAGTRVKCDCVVTNLWKSVFLEWAMEQRFRNRGYNGSLTTKGPW